MRKVEREEIVDYQTYADNRERTRLAIMEVKRLRRIHVGPSLTFLFENTDTIRYQIQEMMRVERIVRDADIRQEIDTYNAVLGDAGELGCCLLVEIDDRQEREQALRQWRALPEHLYVRCQDGALVRARYDRAQVEEDRISSVQYLKFAVGGGRAPVAVGCDLPGIEVETVLTEEQQTALRADLAD
jgi:hypothetical protein